jgi:catechol 2,3-dioxygenase-like lactoylglutathione lyase family enzyme
MPTVSVRYIVNDVDEAIRFYVDHLGFSEVMHPAPTFAMLARGDLRLALTKPGGGPGGGSSLPDGRTPSPGGWNRFAIEVDDLDDEYARLVAAGVGTRSPVIDGVGGRQVIVDDPSGNPVELFQPMIPEARLDRADDTT